MKGMVSNSSLSNKAELVASLDQMSKPDPQAQQLQQQQQQLALQQIQSQIAVNTTQAEQNRADATKTMIEAQLKPKEVEAKVMSSVTNNLPTRDQLASQEFDKRVKIAELMLKEADIKNKSKIVELQMANKQENLKKIENDFLDELSGALK